MPELKGGVLFPAAGNLLLNGPITRRPGSAWPCGDAAASAEVMRSQAPCLLAALAAGPWQAMLGALPCPPARWPRPACAPGDVKAGMEQPDVVYGRVKPDLSLVRICRRGFAVALWVLHPRNCKPELL